MTHKVTEPTPAHSPPHAAMHKSDHDASRHAGKGPVSESADANLKDHWPKLAAGLKEKWSALTDDDLKFVDRTMVGLVAKVHERTGLDADTAERQLLALIASVAPSKQ